ncbi:MAG: hypothetical protein IT532_08825 [Burkholderiales bacterium]|nr:hypothetical protein [Burkholderiales bacterium]
MAALSLRRFVDARALPASDEAAMLFAQGQSDAARLVLEDELARRRTLDARLWALLFGLLRVQGEWQRFDALAERYAASTGLPVPVWLDHPLLARLPEPMRTGGAAYVELYEIAPDLAQRIAHIGQQHIGMHLDVSRLGCLDAADAIRLTDILEQLAQGVVAVVVSGTDQFAARIRTALDARLGNLLLWRLLFALYRLQELEEDFDRAGLEYTLATGFRAPSWEPPLAPVLALQAVEEKRRSPRYQASESLRLRGRIEESTDLQLVTLCELAQQRQYVNVDLSRLGRIAPSPAATLVGAMNELADWGKVVRLLRPHALIESLLQALSLDARVQLVRAQL